MERSIQTISPEEAERQRFFTEEIRSLPQKPSSYFVVTYGCQMNAHDSEKIAGMLEEMGIHEAESREEADFVIFNTCCVRENAERKALGNITWLKEVRKRNPNLMIAVCGCMIQEPGMAEVILRQYRFINLAFGTSNLHKFPELLYWALNANSNTVAVEDRDVIPEDLPIVRARKEFAYITVMYGCNNFCSYCIVPYVRGRERSRTPQEIMREIERLVADGVVEVMLLGQNVNSYGKTLPTPVSFAELLDGICEIDGLKRIRFMTSHPKDLSDELISVMAKHPDKICPHLHLPLQSGSTRILQSMNRHYTKDSYLALVDRIRAAMPDISLTTDIIVGYPGETEEDFQETLDVVRRVRYDSAFTFIYSKRSGTPAAVMEDQVPEDVIKDRFDRLLSLVQQIGREQTARFTGKTMGVLVEQINEQDASLVTGRLDNNIVVHFPGDASLIGKIVPVRLDSCHGFYYLGTRADSDALVSGT